MSISAASTQLSAITAPMPRPKSPPPMTLPGGDKDPTATGKPGVAPMRKDFTAALQAMLLRAQGNAGS